VVLDDAKANTGWMYFLTHTVLLFRIRNRHGDVTAAL
jgi:hypothetical protein